MSSLWFQSSWFDFKTKIGILPSGGERKQRHYGNTNRQRYNNYNQDPGSMFSGPNVETAHQQKLPNQEEVSQYAVNLVDKNQYPEVLDYLTVERGINIEVLRKYCVGAADFNFPDPGYKVDNDTNNTKSLWKKYTCVTFPWIKLLEKMKIATVVKQTFQNYSLPALRLGA